MINLSDMSLRDILGEIQILCINQVDVSFRVGKLCYVFLKKFLGKKFKVFGKSLQKVIERE